MASDMRHGGASDSAQDTKQLRCAEPHNGKTDRNYDTHPESTGMELIFCLFTLVIVGSLIVKTYSLLSCYVRFEYERS
eukprot:5758756-Amphidinium_carterae.1